MFLGIYRFEGDVSELLPAYERLLESIPSDTLSLHVCVQDAGGLWVYDTCPSKDVFQSFASSAGFHDAVKAAGLPPPKVSLSGNVHSAIVSGKRVI